MTQNRQTGSKHTQPLYVRSRFSLTTISPLDHTDFEKIIHTSADLVGILYIVRFENSTFPCIITFLKKIILNIKKIFDNVCSIFHKDIFYH